MTPETTLLRQVHPHFIPDGQLTSQAFMPFPKDDGKASVYDGDQISPADSYVHYTRVLGNKSHSVWGVTCAEVALDLCPLSNPEGRRKVRGGRSEEQGRTTTGKTQECRRTLEAVPESKPTPCGYEALPPPDLHAPDVPPSPLPRRLRNLQFEILSFPTCAFDRSTLTPALPHSTRSPRPTTLECGGRAKRRRRFRPPGTSGNASGCPSQSGVALRLPPQSKMACPLGFDRLCHWPWPRCARWKKR